MEIFMCLVFRPPVFILSINEEIVHAVPSARVPKRGDIISLDLGIKYKGFHTDMAITVPVGNVSVQAAKIIEVTKEALKTIVIPQNTHICPHCGHLNGAEKGKYIYNG